jgi:hypothetical protein
VGMGVVVGVAVGVGLGVGVFEWGLGRGRDWFACTGSWVWCQLYLAPQPHLLVSPPVYYWTQATLAWCERACV